MQRGDQNRQVLGMSMARPRGKIGRSWIRHHLEATRDEQPKSRQGRGQLGLQIAFCLGDNLLWLTFFDFFISSNSLH